MIKVSMTGKIKILLVKKGITQKELADLLMISQPTLSKKFKLDDWRESDLKEIARVCDCQYESSFITHEDKI